MNASHILHATAVVLSLLTPRLALASGEVASESIIRDWVAAGSGCFARQTQTGDVTFQSSEDPSRPEALVARFTVPKLKLSSTTLKSDAPLHFARDCALYVATHPRKGMRISNVTARTQVASSKVHGASLTLESHLLLGSKSLAKNVFTYPAAKSHSQLEKTVFLSPGKSFPKLQCEEAKVIGFDYAWTAKLDNHSKRVEVDVGGAKTLELAIEFEPCSP